MAEQHIIEFHVLVSKYHLAKIPPDDLRTGAAVQAYSEAQKQLAKLLEELRK